MQWASKQKGFTIVELLIVIVVIAILAAITIVSYNGITQRAKDAMAQSSAAQVQRQLATYFVANGETAYPNNLSEIGIGSDGDVKYQFTPMNGSSKGYCVTVTVGSVSYRIGDNFTLGSETVNDAAPTSGVCPGHTTDGSVAVTNYSPNPSFEVNFSGTNEPNGSSRSLSTVRAQSGVNSVRVTIPGSTADGNVGVGIFVPSSYVGFGLKPSTTYTASAYVYVPTGTVEVELAVQGSGRESVGTNAARKTSVKDQWVRVQNTFTTRSTDGSISVYILNDANTGGASTQFWVDSVMITEGTSAPAYADGASPGWAWSGTSHLSTSSGPSL